MDIASSSADRGSSTGNGSNGSGDVECVQKGDFIVVLFNDEEGGSMMRAEGEQKFGKTRSVKHQLMRYAYVYVAIMLLCVYRINVNKYIIGAPYGSVFRIAGKKLEYVSDGSGFVEYSAARDEEALEGGGGGAGTDDEDDGKETVIPGDNRAYVDTNTAQKLDVEDIKKMKEEGASGIDIIKSLISKSETFNSKTSFAQEKW
jgi:hypothetical protein